MRRKRYQLVPEGGVECFELRVVLYFDPEGLSSVSWGVSTPQEMDATVSMHELIGALEFGKAAILADHFAGVERDRRDE